LFFFAKIIISSCSRKHIIVIINVWLFVGSSPSKKTKKPMTETTAGSGAGYKSKEFISDNEASSSDSDDKPLRRKESKKESDSEVGEVESLLVAVLFESTCFTYS